MTRCLLALPILLIALYGAPVDAQMACGERDTVVAALDEKYGEVRRGGGLAGPTAIYEMWANCSTGTWTFLRASPSGWACVMAVGEGWHDKACEKGERA